MAIFDSTVSRVKKSGSHQQVTQPRSFIALTSPINLGHRASPCFRNKAWGKTLSELPVEFGIMGDYHRSGLKEFSNFRRVNAVPQNHLVGNSCELRNLDRNRGRWLAQSIEGIENTEYPAIS